MNPDKPRRQLGGELVIPVLAIVFTLYFFSTIWNSPWTAQVSAFAVGSILLLVCAMFILRCILSIRSGEGSLGFATLFSREDLATGRIGLLDHNRRFLRSDRVVGFHPDHVLIPFDQHDNPGQGQAPGLHCRCFRSHGPGWLGRIYLGL